MARPRTPTAKAELTGAKAKDPQRFRDRSDPERVEIGKPPVHLNELEKKAWAEFLFEWPWVQRSDRSSLASLCVMRVRMETQKEDLKAADFKEYRMQVSAFGGNPTTVSKIYMPKGDEEINPFDEFVQ